MNRLINVTGNDAVEFLQGQLTQDVDRVSKVSSLPAAWCTSKGRVLATMRVLAVPDGVGLIVPEDVCDAVIARFTMYRFRAKVEFAASGPAWRSLAVNSTVDVATLQSKELLPRSGMTLSSLGIHAVRPDVVDDYIELYGAEDAFRSADISIQNALSNEEWLALRIRAGIPTISSDNAEKFTPHMLNLDLLGAISFSKGCYTGQEIVARTENRGRSRRRLARLIAETAGIEVGSKISHAGKEIGEVVNAAGTDILAVMPTVEPTAALSVGDNSLALAALPYPT